jgi:hypothetical protein
MTGKVHDPMATAARGSVICGYGKEMLNAALSPHRVAAGGLAGS